WVTLRRGSIAAAARRLDGDPIARSQQVTFALREMWRSGEGAALADKNLVDRAGAAAEQTRRSDAAVIHQERGFRLTAQQADPEVDAKAAAVAAGAARAFAQGKAVEQDRVM